MSVKVFPDDNQHKVEPIPLNSSQISYAVRCLLLSGLLSTETGCQRRERVRDPDEMSELIASAQPATFRPVERLPGSEPRELGGARRAASDEG